MEEDHLATFHRVLSRVYPEGVPSDEVTQAVANKILPVLNALPPKPVREDLANLDYISIARMVVLLSSDLSDAPMSDDAVRIILDDDSYLEKLAQHMRPIAALVMDCMTECAMEADLNSFDAIIDDELARLLG